MKILVTGGSGFIGSALIRHLLAESGHAVVNLDKLTYAANPLSLASVEADSRYEFEKADICDGAAMAAILARHRPDLLIHLAAESHVDRSIDAPAEFVNTNIVGTMTLLDASLRYFEKLDSSAQQQFRFHHVSTDEVFGDLEAEASPFSETTAYAPSSPYSASKAASDHLVRAWHRTYGLPVVITNCSNNYGPCQFPEKLIPLMILNALRGRRLPVYGDGRQVRDWLYVEDHARALELAATRGEIGATYCIGGNSELTNLEVVQAVCALLETLARSKPEGVAHYEDLLEFVTDRPGHDRRYAIDASLISAELGWQPRETFASGLEKTIRWYLENPHWWQSIADGSYLKWRQEAQKRHSSHA